MPMYKTQEAQNRWHCSLFLVPTKYVIKAAVGTNRTQHKKHNNDNETPYHGGVASKPKNVLRFRSRLHPLPNRFPSAHPTPNHPTSSVVFASLAETHAAPRTACHMAKGECKHF